MTDLTLWTFLLPGFLFILNTRFPQGAYVPSKWHNMAEMLGWMQPGWVRRNYALKHKSLDKEEEAAVHPHFCGLLDMWTSASLNSSTRAAGGTQAAFQTGIQWRNPSGNLNLLNWFDRAFGGRFSSSPDCRTNDALEMEISCSPMTHRPSLWSHSDPSHPMSTVQNRHLAFSQGTSGPPHCLFSLLHPFSCT